MPLKTYDIKYNADLELLQDTFKSFKPKIQELKKHIDNADSLTKENEHKMFFSALSPIVPIRRVSSLEDNLKDGNYGRAAGLIGLMALNLPEDTRDLKDAAKQIFLGKTPIYDYKNCQAPFSFFRGTLLEPIVNKLGKFGVKLYSWDKTLYETKFGEFLCKVFKIETYESKLEFTGRQVPKVFINKEGKSVINKVDIFAHKLEGKPLSKLIGRALLRIPVISVVVLAALELPAIIKKISSADNAKNKLKEGSKQTLKSAVNVISLISGIGLFGALLAKKGPAYSLLGMGIGSVIGSAVSKAVQKEIDDIATGK